jgi:hypothetical protein
MAEAALAEARLAAAGIEVRNMPGMYAAVLRYFEPGGAFAAAVSSATGTGLPGPLAAAVAALTGTSGSELVLAWSRPTETLLLTRDEAALGELLRRLASADGGYVVNLSGGLAVLRLTGARVEELIGRLGGAAVPQPLEARRGRLADVPVLAVCVRAGEILLVVDRSLAGHLTAWIGETLEDFRR